MPKKRKNSKDAVHLLAQEAQQYIVYDDKLSTEISGNEYHDKIEELKKSEKSSFPSDVDISSEGVCKDLPCQDFKYLLKPNTEAKESDQNPLGFFNRAISTVGRVFPWVTSKAVVKTVNIIVPSVAFAGIGALSGGIVPVVAIGIAGGTILSNTIRDTRALRALKELEQEHSLLTEYQFSKNLEKRANDLIIRKTGVDLIGTDFDIPDKTPRHTFKPKYENNLTPRSLGKTIRGNLFASMGNIAVTVVAATSGAANAAMNAMSIGVGAGVVGIVDVALTTINRRKINIIKNGMRKNIDMLREGVPSYDNIETLRMLTREQKIKTEALSNISNTDLHNWDLENLTDGLNLQKVIAGQKFEVPIRPSFWQKTKQYFKDFNSVNWPNDYYTGERFAGKLDKDSKELVGRYNVLSQEIQRMSKKHEESKTLGAQDRVILQHVISGKKKIGHAAGNSVA